MYSNFIKYPSNAINYLVNSASKNKAAAFIIVSTSIYVGYYLYCDNMLSHTLKNNNKPSNKREKGNT